MIGIKDIAKAAGVSTSTVSNVLNGKKNVGEDTKDKILQLCSEMKYYPNVAGKILKSGKSHTILFVFSDFDRSFYLRIIEGINDYVNDNGFDLIICSQKSSLKYMQSNLTRGCIILDERVNNGDILKVASENYHVVVLDRIIDNPYIKSVLVNNYDSMTSLVQIVIEKGYRKFGFIGGPEYTDDNKERFKAFLDTLEKNNIEFFRKNYFSGDYREKSGYRAGKIFLLSEELPEVLVCANDNMAIGAIKAFEDAGLRVPEDIAVTGFDDCDFAESSNLTTVKIPNYERGYLAARCLIENIKGDMNMDTLFISATVKLRNSILDKNTSVL